MYFSLVAGDFIKCYNPDNRHNRKESERFKAFAYDELAKRDKVITHEKAMTDCLRELELFYSALSPLKERLLCFLIQLPPSISFKTGFKAMKNFASILDRRYRYAVEVRHPSWFNEDFYDFLTTDDICLVWNQLDAIQASPVLTTDFYPIQSDQTPIL